MDKNKFRAQPAEFESRKAGMPPHIVEIHNLSWKHKAQIQESKLCGCFDCCQLFSPQEIDRWLEEEGTALCPKCGSDTVLPEKPGVYLLAPELLEEMHRYWCAAE